jgi:hypothetical protein
MALDLVEAVRAALEQLNGAVQTDCALQTSAGLA